jgi:hypothetical protein
MNRKTRQKASKEVKAREKRVACMGVSSFEYHSPYAKLGDVAN